MSFVLCIPVMSPAQVMDLMSNVIKQCFALVLKLLDASKMTLAFNLFNQDGP